MIEGIGLGVIVGLLALIWMELAKISETFEAIDEERDRLEMEALRGDY